MVYIDSWTRSTGYDDETSMNGVASYLFGARGKTKEILDVNYMKQVHEASKLGQYYNTNSSGNMTLDQILASFYPVNGILFWQMYGKATHTVADQTQTIVNLTTTEGKKTKIKAWSQWDASNAFDLFGLCCNQMKLDYSVGQGLLAQQSFMGCKSAKSSATPTAAVYPDDASNDEIDGVFNVFDSWTWNNNTCEKPMNFAMEAMQPLVPYMKGTGSYYAELSEHSPIVTGFTAACRGDTELANMITDWLAGTKRTLTWKMLKSEDISKYFEVTASNCLIRAITPVRNPAELLGYTVSITSENVSTVVVDYVDDDFYTIAT